jgi:flagellar biosynthesis protein FliQ
MTPELIVNFGKHALEVTLVMMSLLLLPALAVGLLVSILQAATQINEMTLSFIPKLLVTAAALVLGGPFLLRVLTDYTITLFESIPALAH